MTITTGLALVAAGVATTGANQSPKDAAIAELKKQLPNLTGPQITESEISGLFQVTAGDQVFYWHPNGFLVLGEIWDVKKGKSLTAEKKELARNERDKSLGTKIAKLPIEKAIKIGNGKNVIIEFTDPDCPYYCNFCWYCGNNDIKRSRGLWRFCGSNCWGRGSNYSRCNDGQYASLCCGSS